MRLLYFIKYIREHVLVETFGTLFGDGNCSSTQLSEK